MITKVSVENRNLNSLQKYNSVNNNNDSLKKTDLSFKNAPLGFVLWGLQRCEENPMLNVAVVDMCSAILPRTLVESKTNLHAGFEAFRRESSGLIVNCLIPSLIACGAAFGLNKFIMPKGSNMSTCWADYALIDKITNLYSKSTSTDKVKDVLKQLLGNIEGVDRDQNVILKDKLKNELDVYVDKLKKLIESNKTGKELRDEIKQISNDIASKVHIYENIKIKGETDVKLSNLNSALKDFVKFFKEYNKVEKTVNIETFAKKSKYLVNGKSILGLSIVLPLAASMQYINRWITKKTSGIDGAPIYEDFGAKENEELRKKSQEGLLKQKMISISSMLGVALLSMMKLPSWNMLQFKGWFPTMDQARIISATTFASRMAVADDKNELAEATVRDIATFLGLYFLGDYAGKGVATIVEKKTGVKLLNHTKPIAKDANAIQKFWHWFKDVNIKSSEEVVSKTQESLNGQAPTEEQVKKIVKELKKARNWRSCCQVANLVVSLILLGAIVPSWTRNKTKKKHEEQLKQVQMDKDSNLVSSSTKIRNAEI